jgi:predicted outer membrane repeat protein
VDSYAGDNSITGATGNAAEVVLDGGGVNTVLSLYDDLHSNLLEVVDLTIANGSGTDGGNLSCSVQNGNRSPAFILDNVIVTGGFASGDGGGLYGEDCGANITDSTFSNNTSIGKGGAMILHSFTISNTVISGNQSGTYGGGIYTDMSGNSCGMFNSTLTDTWFLANTAAIGGSALYLTSTAGGPGGPGATDWIEMSCTTPGSGGFHGNQSPGWGAIVLSSNWNGFDLQGSSRFKVTEGFPCDFGEPGTTDDNSPNDVYVMGVGTYDYGDGRTINCSSSNWANTNNGSCSATDGL